MRLIDADRLLSKRMQSKYYHLPNGDIAIPIIDIEYAPIVKSEIIRCKDCKHWKQQTNYQGTPLSFGFCESDNMWHSLYGETTEVEHIDTDDNHYCGFAERKTNVVTYPCTTENGVYTSGCITNTHTSSPNEDFHPVLDCMISKERTAKVEHHGTISYPFHNCGECGREVEEYDEYCRQCGAKLEWK